ncbi:hypothetical protein BXZ70DRAFT_1007592 [Cristinia sonorae]|uniref:Uncharacterized protein n=1 Tax=Cristinia sonorae TaxID=1940300 RepID=A0A8K0URS2_9AGAR|nr:hypothetical protein BXZ70DRAFT_1007592 [Cristinia sonorae]
MEVDDVDMGHAEEPDKDIIMGDATQCWVYPPPAYPPVSPPGYGSFAFNLENENGPAPQASPYSSSNHIHNRQPEKASPSLHLPEPQTTNVIPHQTSVLASPLPPPYKSAQNSAPPCGGGADRRDKAQEQVEELCSDMSSFTITVVSATPPPSSPTHPETALIPVNTIPKSSPVLGLLNLDSRQSSISVSAAVEASSANVTTSKSTHSTLHDDEIGPLVPDALLLPELGADNQISLQEDDFLTQWLGSGDHSDSPLSTIRPGALPAHVSEVKALATPLTSDDLLRLAAESAGAPLNEKSSLVDHVSQSRLVSASYNQLIGPSGALECSPEALACVSLPTPEQTPVRRSVGSLKTLHHPSPVRLKDAVVPAWLTRGLNSDRKGRSRTPPPTPSLRPCDLPKGNPLVLRSHARRSRNNRRRGIPKVLEVDRCRSRRGGVSESAELVPAGPATSLLPENLLIGDVNARDTAIDTPSRKRRFSELTPDADDKEKEDEEEVISKKNKDKNPEREVKRIKWKDQAGNGNTLAELEDLDRHLTIMQLPSPPHSPGPIHDAGSEHHEPESHSEDADSEGDDPQPQATADDLADTMPAVQDEADKWFCKVTPTPGGLAKIKLTPPARQVLAKQDNDPFVNDELASLLMATTVN